MDYQEINAKAIDRWVEQGWEWGKPISHIEYLEALKGNYKILLTPTKPINHEWFKDFKGKKVLGLACGGAQQMPIFAALGADCTVLDNSVKQLESEEMMATKEGYDIRIIKADMTKPLPFNDEEFDYIVNPVSNSYIENVIPLFKECYRILKKGGIFMAGLDTGLNYAFDDDETTLVNTLPFNPLINKDQLEQLVENDDGIQFSHTLEEQVGGQLKAGFILLDIIDDTNGSGTLHEHNIPTFIITRAKK